MTVFKIFPSELECTKPGGGHLGHLPPEIFNTLHGNFEKITSSYWLIISL